MLILNCSDSNSIYEYTHFRLGTSQAAISMKVGSSLLLSWYLMAIFTMCIFISNNCILGLRFWVCFVLFPSYFRMKGTKLMKWDFTKRAEAKAYSSPIQFRLNSIMLDIEFQSVHNFSSFPFRSINFGIRARSAFISENFLPSPI